MRIAEGIAGNVTMFLYHGPSAFLSSFVRARWFWISMVGTRAKTQQSAEARKTIR